MAFNLDEVTELLDSSVFSMKEVYESPFLLDKGLLQGYSIMMSMDQLVIERSGYTLLDVLSDIGGIQGILISGISFILSILNHNHLDNYLVAKLFKSESAELLTSKTANIKEYCLSKIVPRKLVCCHKKRK